ncbi:hypothetical protein TVNIR_0258 [Thioalkalivibrio nitratireducens DSM 14787]|uniref:Uncharacterized protein n=1 Tax=Thioalkalivibrio nitratireducens (strain DSM 14787 / UNIQEM 213 / ALEN2) TaxID=1255043 RepID=L0DQW9_THIND|nr:hypothetical protein TVNIR_0258 [Thioalkalivibrio nitratireducens DSM 14787]
MSGRGKEQTGCPRNPSAHTAESVEIIHNRFSSPRPPGLVRSPSSRLSAFTVYAGHPFESPTPVAPPDPGADEAPNLAPPSAPSGKQGRGYKPRPCFPRGRMR